MHEQLRSGGGSAVKVALQRVRRAMKKHKKHPPPDQKHLTPSDAETSSWLCVRRKSKKPHAEKYEVDVYHPIQTISRSSDGKFVLQEGPPHQAHSLYPGHPVSVAPLNLDDPIDPPQQFVSPPNGYYKDFDIPQDYLSRRHNVKDTRNTFSKRDSISNRLQVPRESISNRLHVPRESISNRLHVPRESISNRLHVPRDSISNRLQVPRDYLTSVDNIHSPLHVQSPINSTQIQSPSDVHSPGVTSRHTPLGAGWYEDPYFQQSSSPFKFGAWRKYQHDTPTTPVRDSASLRHNATPSNQTYLTSSPDQNASNTIPFVISDVSSVNPSFSTNGDRSHSGHGNIVISDSSMGHNWSGDHHVPTNVHQWHYPLPGDYYRQVRNLAGQYGHPLDSPGSVALYQIPESQGSSPEELTYTREHLDKAIQKVRAGHTPQGSIDSTEHVSANNANNANKKPGPNTKQPAANFKTSVAPYKSYMLSGSTSSSGVGSGTAAGVPRLPVYQRHLSSPNSSGIGSRENSHSTGSVSHAPGESWDPGNAVVPPLASLSPRTPSGSDEHHLNEWYRWTPTGPYLESSIEPRMQLLAGVDLKDGSGNQERCRRLREEYLAFQLSHHSGDKPMSQGSYVQEMESEML